MAPSKNATNILCTETKFIIELITVINLEKWCGQAHCDPYTILKPSMATPLTAARSSCMFYGKVQNRNK